MRFRLQSIHLYLGAGLSIAAVAIAIITGFAATRQNSQSLATQQIIAGFETQAVYQYLKGQTHQMAYWQEAFDHTARQWDEKWVSYQFGDYQDSMGNHLVAIVGPSGALRLLHATGKERTVKRDGFMRAAGLGALVDATRKAGMQHAATTAQGVIVVDGKAFFATASFITPENEKDLAFGRSHPFIAIFCKEATASQFEGLATGFNAEFINVTPENHAYPGYAEFALKDAAGRAVAWLEWKPYLPGAQFLHTAALPLIAVLLVLMFIQALVIHHWLSMQRRLISAQTETGAAHEQSRLKSVFLGTISHELRTPLNAIIGYSDVLCCQLFGPLGSPRNTEYVRDIRDSGQRLLKIVNDLIEIARIEAQDKGANDEWFDVAVAARRAITSLEQRAAEKNIKVLLSAPREEAWCQGSLLSLGQAIERILSNAIRHSREGGRVDVKVTQLTDEILIEIRDYGEGIAKDRLADLARPFGHPENHLITPDRKALGFGIPIAKGLVQLMGGILAIDSEPGKGTTVRIRFPARTPQSQPLSEASESDAATAGRKHTRLFASGR